MENKNINVEKFCERTSFNGKPLIGTAYISIVGSGGGIAGDVIGCPAIGVNTGTVVNNSGVNGTENSIVSANDIATIENNNPLNNSPTIVGNAAGVYGGIHNSPAIGQSGDINYAQTIHNHYLPPISQSNQVRKNKCNNRCHEECDSNDEKIQWLKKWQNQTGNKNFQNYLMLEGIVIRNPTNFNGLVLNALQFARKSLENMDFSHAVLARCGFFSTTVKDVTLDMSNITNIDIDTETLSRTNFSGLIICQDCAADQFAKQNEKVFEATEIMLKRYKVFRKLIQATDSQTVAANKLWITNNQFVLFQIPYIKKMIESVDAKVINQNSVMNNGK